MGKLGGGYHGRVLSWRGVGIFTVLENFFSKLAVIYVLHTRVYLTSTKA